MVKISVIMPVYNVEEYIRETLDSLLNQTMIDDIEVLMIDDGSTDDSRYIIEEYALDHENFHAYHKKNEGQGIARNYGMELARGEYVHFMDADDYIPPKAYETLYNFNHDNDFIVGNVLKYGQYNVWENVLFKHAFKGFDGDIKSFTFMDYPQLIWDSIICDKFYKKEFLDENNIRFPNKKIFYEDILFTFNTYSLAKSIGFSNDIFYYWRSRPHKSSVTQVETDVVNFMDRLEILRTINEKMDEYKFTQEFKNLNYSKWLNHDLRTSLYKLANYPEEYYPQLIDETNDILSIIPQEVRDDVNSYKKVMYKMVENRDIDSLVGFSNLELELKETDYDNLRIDDEYLKLIDFEKDAVNEEFEAVIEDIVIDDDKLLIKFMESIDYLKWEYPHETTVNLVDGAGESRLEVQNNTIVLPLKLVKDKNDLMIKVEYIADNFKKTDYLKTSKRKTLNFEGFDIDFNLGINKYLHIDYINKNINEIEIKEITFENNEFKFNCQSSAEIDELTLKNMVFFNEMTYPVVYQGDNEFTFSIPYEDILMPPVKKWELNCKSYLNSIKLSKRQVFYTKSSKIIFSNDRSKILIRNYILNADYEFNQLRERIKVLKTKNKKLKKDKDKLTQKNINLEDRIDEFKSRKVVRFSDKLKFR
jgi:glycosyltransferase involved in cell wall biosynthesis